MLTLLASAFAAPLTPTFAWAPGDRWDVTFAEHTERTGTGAQVTTQNRARWTMTVSGTPGALVITPSDYHFEPTTGMDWRDGAGTYIHAIAASAPSFRLDAKAALVELLDIPTQRAAAERTVDAVGVLNAEAKTSAKASFSDARLQAQVSAWWTHLVGTWAAVPLAQGQPDTYSAKAPVPALAQMSVQTDNSRVYDGPVACAPGSAPTCEAFTLRSTLNPSAAGVALGEFATRPGPLKLSSTSLETTVHLITEASDLRPRSLSWVRKSHSKGTASATLVEVSMVEERTWTFTPRVEGSK